MLLAAAAFVGPGAQGGPLGSFEPDPGYAFRDDAWTGGGPPGTRSFMRPLWAGAPGCSERLRSCTREFRRAELFTSTAADASPNRVIDLNGHALGVSGMVITERVAPSGAFEDFGVTTMWDVGGEQAFDDAGTHAWEVLYPDASPNAKWLPIQSYRFEVATPQADIPEPQTWELLGIGFAALASAAMMRRHIV